MKLALTILAALALCVSALAQTVTNPPPPLPPVGNPFSGVLGYLTDPNSKLLADETLELRLGTSQAGFANNGSSDFGASFGGSWYFAQNFGVGGEILTKNIAGDVVSGNLDLEVSKALGNIRLTGFAGAGYNLDIDSPVGEAGARVSVIPLNSTTRIGVYTQIAWDVKLKGGDYKPATRLEFGVFYPF